MPPHPPPKASLDSVAELLTRVATGELSVDDAVANLGHGSIHPAADQQVTLDLDRARRCGFPEVVYGQGKPVELIKEIIARQQAAAQPSLVTRVEDSAAVAITTAFPHARFSPIARTVVVGIEETPAPTFLTELDEDGDPIHAAVVSAGSTDAPVAEEAIETLAWMGIPMRAFHDIGVAGPQRLLAAVPALRLASAVVVVAGMEGALPAAVGGHLDAPVFAVPTSVGYGATLGGLTPLLGMLSSCASNVAVVNIDAGFKAGYLAGLVASRCARG